MPVILGEATSDGTGNARRVVEHDEQVGEIDARQDQADDRHEHIIDNRRHDGAESGTDHHADGEIDDIALEGEIAEFLEHVSSSSLLRGQFTPGGGACPKSE
jgi:hypothetical protein